MKIDSTTVQLVIAVADEGSISRAADKLNLAVAAASKRLSDPERQLDCKLFKRVAHGVRITEPGQKLLGHLRQMDNLLERLQGDARVLRQGQGGRIILGAPKSALLQFLAQDIAAVARKYPDITLEVIEENSKIVQQLLRDRVIDLGIYEQTSGFIDLPQHAYRQDSLGVVYSRAHVALDGASPLALSQLLELPIVTLGRGSAILAALQRAHQRSGRLFQSNFTVSGFDTMLALVRQGVGVGLMPPAIFASFHPEAGLGWADLQGDWHRRRFVLSVVEGQAQAQTLHNVMAELLAGATAAV